MITVLPFVFSIGVLSRIADMIADDGLRLNRYIGYAVGAVYGFLSAYVITQYTVLAELGIAVMLAVLFTFKIDHPVHGTGIATAFLFLVIYGLNPLDISLLAIFMAAGASDEIGNHLSDKRKLKGIVGHFFRLRMTMEVAAFAVSFYTGNWILFLAMLSYDTGFTYIFPDPVRRKLIRFAGQ